MGPTGCIFRKIKKRNKTRKPKIRLNKTWQMKSMKGWPKCKKAWKNLPWIFKNRYFNHRLSQEIETSSKKATFSMKIFAWQIWGISTIGRTDPTPKLRCPSPKQSISSPAKHKPSTRNWQTRKIFSTTERPLLSTTTSPKITWLGTWTTANRTKSIPSSHFALDSAASSCWASLTNIYSPWQSDCRRVIC